MVKFLGASQQQQKCKFHQIFIVSDKTTHKAFINHKTLFQTKPIRDFFFFTIYQNYNFGFWSVVWHILLAILGGLAKRFKLIVTSNDRSCRLTEITDFGAIQCLIENEQFTSKSIDNTFSKHRK